jgi:hypothetical protein
MMIFYGDYLITIEKSKYHPEDIWYGYVTLANHSDFYFCDCIVEESSFV